MYNAIRYFYPNGKKDEFERTRSTSKEFPTIEKAIAYAYLCSGSAKFAACMIEDKKGKLIYEILESGRAFDHRFDYR